MSDNTTDFFDGIGGGTGAPTAVLKNVNDMVVGEIVEMFKRDYIPFGEKEPEKRDDGSNKQQLVVILQTANRGWANVVKVPKVDPADPNSPEKPAAEDDGKRAVYVPEGKNLQFAIGRAVTAAAEAAGRAVRFEVGGTLAVRIFNLKPTDKGNALKEHEARYTPKSVGAEFFGAAAPAAPVQQQPPAQPVQQAPVAPPVQQAPPAPPVQQAPPAQDPWATQPPAQPVQQAPAPVAQPAPAQDPWATPAAPAAPAAPSQDPWGAPAAPQGMAPPF